MCGITGVYQLTPQEPEELDTINRMLGMIRHRGPDGGGVYLSDRVGLGSARLSIVDIAGGQQPMGNEDSSLWVVFNGEIFNYPDLRPGMEAASHVFQTQCDTEVLLHLYESYGPAFLNRLNGQFAMALWDEKDHSLFLGRDRLGVRPLYYTIHDSKLIFGSEIKTILAYPGLKARLSMKALGQTFTAWAPLSPLSAFQEIYELPPGHFLVARDGSFRIERYWSPDFSEDSAGRTGEDYQDEFEELLIDSARIRLRADVPVGAYLSGGLDSSVITAVIQGYTGAHLDTFSIAFSDPNFDESPFQNEMAAALQTDHHIVRCSPQDIGGVFPEVIWHSEAPLLRTSPAPMLLLSKLVHESGYKVVLTGEGADEFLGGYDIFKEMKIRRFWSKRSESTVRPRLLAKLYPEITGLSGGSFLSAFFGRDLGVTDSPYYSHLIRWNNTARTRRFLKDKAVSQNPTAESIFADIPLPPAFDSWSHLGQAQYLEISTFLSTYLLSAQGDRMSMANSVEGRYPFLDYRLVDFANRLPVGLKLPGLSEKFILRRFGRKLLPPSIWQRRKKPYRAPIHDSFFSLPRLDYVDELLSKEALDNVGYFDSESVGMLVNKASASVRLSEIDEMALVGILSTQLLDHTFVKNFPSHNLSEQYQPLKVVDRRSNLAALHQDRVPSSI
ncbi:MAG: asparagine synthase (glutamine-hydrolyzing) [Anaerolineaceae bacterium]